MAGLKLVPKGQEYQPNLRDSRVRRRIAAVLDWCDLNLYERDPVRLSAINDLTPIFGQAQNALSNWLRHRLLRQIGGYTPGKANYAYLLKEGSIQSLRTMLGEPAVALTDVQRYERKYATELTTLRFQYNDKSNRLWHPLQNVEREKKPALWEKYLPFDYDINACAPNLLTQTAARVGLAPEALAGVQRFLDDKTGFRQHVADLTGMSYRQAKAVINSMFNGAKLHPHRSCSTFEVLGFDKDALQRLKTDPQVVELLASVKAIWAQLDAVLEGGRGAKWRIYFRLEREVIDVCHQYLRDAGNPFFSEHDGWRCQFEVDTDALEALIFEKTGYRLKFDKN